MPGAAMQGHQCMMGSWVHLAMAKFIRFGAGGIVQSAQLSMYALQHRVLF